MSERQTGSWAKWSMPDDFLSELPDLISGSDPELLKPVAREWLRNHPSAREFADRLRSAVTEISNVPAHIARSTGERLPSRAARGVRTAIDRLPHQLSEIVWALLSIEIDGLAKQSGGMFIVPTRADLSFSTLGNRLRWERDRIIAFANEQHVEPLSTRLRTKNPSESLGRIEDLIAMFAICRPKHSMVQWSRLLVEYFSNQVSDGANWRSFIRDAEVTAYYDYVLQTGALARESVGDLHGALELCDRLHERFPSSAAAAGAAYTGLKVSTLTGERTADWRYFERLRRALSIAPNQTACWRQQFLIDAEDWRAASVSRPWLLREMFDLLGSQS